MNAREVLAALKERGFDLRLYHIEAMIKNDRISRPPLSAGRRVFSAGHVGEIENYLRSRQAAVVHPARDLAHA